MPPKSQKPASKASAPASKGNAKKTDSNPPPAKDTVAVELPAPTKTTKRATSGASRNDKPTYIEMIMQAIEESKEKNGLSRKALKKALQDNWGVVDDSKANASLSSAIKKGVESGKLVLPKGSSGCVKLAPAGGKENEGAEDAKPKGTTARTKALAKKAADDAKAASKKKAPVKKAAPKKAAPAKEAPAKKGAAPAKKAPAQQVRKMVAVAAPEKKAGRAAPKDRTKAAAAKPVAKRAPRKSKA